ncbi:MAG: type II secretion system protein [Eubacterium sp.]
MSDQRGMTMIELIVVLAIMALLMVPFVGLGASVNKGIETCAFDTECQMVLNKIIQLQNETMMLGDLMSNTVTFYDSKIIFSCYDRIQNRHVSEIMLIKHSKLKGNLLRQKIRFSPMGTASPGGTLEFVRNNKTEKELIVQIGKGRIYLTK